MPFLHFYPEDAGKTLGEARQGTHWLKDLRPEETTPMIRVGAHDYYILEPAMLKDFTFCIPERWLTRNGIFWAHAWNLEVQVVDEVRGWVVRKDCEIEVSEHDLARNFVGLQDQREYYQGQDLTFRGPPTHKNCKSSLILGFKIYT